MTEDLGAMHEMGGLDLSPENISPLVVWLGSPLSSAVTGRVFSVIRQQDLGSGGLGERALCGAQRAVDPR